MDMDVQAPSRRPDRADPRAMLGAAVGRRSIVLLGLLGLAGCATRSSQQALRAPGPVFPEVPMEGPDAPTDTSDLPRPVVASKGDAGVAPKAGPSATAAGTPLMQGPVPFALSRQSWARGAPVVRKMDPMLPPRWITVHHDGMKPFLSDGESETKARLELIRNGHLGRDGGWGDIGYHFVVDRAGRVWEGRSLRYQGAHVKWCNENNIGVMCLGNFEEQQPSEAQVEGLERTLAALRSYYRIPMSKVRTHREWPTARTQCPGANLQAKVVVLRRNSAGG